MKQTKAQARGTAINPVGRFERLDIEPEDDPDFPSEEDEVPRPLLTQFFKNSSKSVLSFNDSPDIGSNVMINPYRGCEHGCIYCFARPTHEYLGLSAGMDFESKIFIKNQAPALLRKELNKKSWRPQTISISGATDPYQPIERQQELTRACLNVLAEFRNPAAIITKNHLVTRDLDILKDMAAWNGIGVSISLTTLNADLAKKMEPRTSRPAARLKAIETLSNAGIPVNVMTAPIIPGLTDHEIPQLLKAASEAGARSAAYVMIRLSYGLRELFQDWLEDHYPEKKPRVLARIQDVRGDKLNDTRWGIRKTGEGPYADLIKQSFRMNKKKYGLDNLKPGLNTEAFRRRPDDGQMDLF